MYNINTLFDSLSHVSHVTLRVSVTRVTASQSVINVCVQQQHQQPLTIASIKAGSAEAAQLLGIYCIKSLTVCAVIYQE